MSPTPVSVLSGHAVQARIRCEKKRSINMLSSAIVWVVDFCARRRWQALIVGTALAAVAATYDIARFSITTDTEDLISRKLAWNQRQSFFSTAFPPKGISVVITAATPENVAVATSSLVQDLAKHPD